MEMVRNYSQVGCDSLPQCVLGAIFLPSPPTGHCRWLPFSEPASAIGVLLLKSFSAPLSLCSSSSNCCFFSLILSSTLHYKVPWGVCCCDLALEIEFVFKWRTVGAKGPKFYQENMTPHKYTAILKDWHKGQWSHAFLLIRAGNFSSKPLLSNFGELLWIVPNQVKRCSSAYLGHYLNYSCISISWKQSCHSPLPENYSSLDIFSFSDHSVFNLNFRRLTSYIF